MNFLAALGLGCCVGFSSFGDQGLLSGCDMWASHFSGFSWEHGLKGVRASVVVVYELSSCLMACGIFPDQGPNLWPLHWQVDS